MNGIKNFKNMYSILTICLILVGAVLLIAPGIALDVVCIIFGIYMIIYGAVKILGFFAKDAYQLAQKKKKDMGQKILSILHCSSIWHFV